MKELNFKQMEVISAGLTQNQTCFIGGGVAFLGGIFFGVEFGVAVAVGALFYGCF